jgi:DNA-directed RNA polymerase subunit omega
MARVTVEDCIEEIPNRFELVMIAAQRARKISSGAPLTIERNNEKNPVLALREVAAETVNPEDLKEELTRAHQMMVAYEEDEDEIDLMDGEEEWEAMVTQAKVEEKQSLYGDEEIVDDVDDDVSLADIAGRVED